MLYINDSHQIVYDNGYGNSMFPQSVLPLTCMGIILDQEVFLASMDELILSDYIVHGDAMRMQGLKPLTFNH